MTALRAIAWRELLAMFRIPAGWIVIFLMLLLSGIVFGFATLRPGGPASMRDFFNVATWIMTFLAPAISMRTLAEEKRSGALEMLTTNPVSEWSIVVGKYLGALGFLLCALAPTLVFVVALRIVAAPDPGPIISGYLGVMLLGALYLAIGVLFSSMTSNQTAAFLGTVFALVLLRLATVQGAAALPAPVSQALFAMSIDLRLADFAKGVIDTSHLIFFVGASAWFIVLATLVVESRRWR